MSDTAGGLIMNRKLDSEVYVEGSNEKSVILRDVAKWQRAGMNQYTRQILSTAWENQKEKGEWKVIKPLGRLKF